MLAKHQPADPKTHEVAQRIAKRFVRIIQAILRDEEKGEALREAYQVAYEELEKFQATRNPEGWTEITT